MMRKTVVACLTELKNGRMLSQKRYVLPEIIVTSKYSTSINKNKTGMKDEDDDSEFDKPIKFSTSKAATFPAAYTTAEAQGVPWYQGIVISLSLSVFLIYFCILREENDIDEKMVKNIPTEVLEQIYGKPKNKK